MFRVLGFRVLGYTCCKHISGKELKQLFVGLLLGGEGRLPAQDCVIMKREPLRLHGV